MVCLDPTEYLLELQNILHGTEEIALPHTWLWYALKPTEYLLELQNLLHSTAEIAHHAAKTDSFWKTLGRSTASRPHG